jgi:hypothetical protein
MENELLSQAPQPSKSNGYIIAISICILVGLLYYWISPYLYKLISFIEMLRSTLDMLISFSSSLSQNVVDETSIGSKIVVNKLSRPKKPPSTPAPDDSSSTIQGTSGYCYVGEWKGVRSCVKVDKKTPCKSQVYSTEELCVNPTLRP